MSLNLTKTKFISFTNRATQVSTSYRVERSIVELVLTYKFLGVHLHYDLTRNHHIYSILAAANRSLGIIKHNLKHAPVNIHKFAYTTVICLKLEYKSII